MIIKRDKLTSIPPVDFEVYEETLDDLPESEYKHLEKLGIPVPDRKHIEDRMKEWKLKNWKGVTLDILISSDDMSWIGYIVDSGKWFYREGKNTEVKGLEKDYDSLKLLLEDLVKAKNLDKDKVIKKVLEEL